MKVIRVCKAQPAGGKVVPSIVIEIHLELPDSEATPKFSADAYNLESALHESLPGGTYDRLLGAMLQRRASSLIRSFEQVSHETA